MAILDPRRERTVFLWTVLGLVLAASAVFLPIWAPLVLAAWIATIARPLLTKIAAKLGGRHRAAGVLVALLVVAVIAPLAITLMSLSLGAADLVKSVAASQGVRQALIAVAAGGGGGEGDPLAIMKSPEKVLGLVQDYGAQALSIVSAVAGAATAVLLGVFVFVYAVFVFLVDGPKIYTWGLEHSPLSTEQTRRLTAAFHETGKGLFVGVGLTGIAQGVAATIAYFALGVPRALVLGLLTCVASLLPSVGTALVWVPVAVGLAFAGRFVPAAVVAGVGIVVIGSIDNLLRPVFARFGKLELSAFMLVTSVFGGVAMFGAGGLLLGPLLARLAKEALVLAREAREHEPDA